MIKHRVIPVLLLQENGLVKTKKFSSPVYLGDPINAINIFNDKEVDELILLDIDASKYNNPINFDLIADITKECFMPFSYGGGIKNIKDVEKLFKLGVEKIILNTSLTNKNLIKQAVQMFGSQSIVASIDIKKDKNIYKIYSYLKKEFISDDIMDYIKDIEQQNIGEIFVNNIDKDGMQNGYDIELMKLLSAHVNIPMIACGGAGNLNDMKELIDKTSISAVAAGSLFVFYGVHNAVLITYPVYGELEKILEDKNV